ncbi:MAG: hypothetical protein IAE87_00350 [Rhodobacteraceae bacterium]|nr:hypothetical protein [Paracoccaceae bacterium]
MMGPMNSVSPVVATAQTAGQHTGNMNSGAGSTLHNGARSAPAAAAEIARPVQQVAGSERPAAPADRPVPAAAEPPAMVASARARAEAAQRAYTMAALAAGLNPLIDPVP